ncbi:YitT family protein [Sediminibacillus dalangtanensis]|uniref:YitT family protein n=1 Tax=Sediminibacillus dalangtanensis TaxID=2729421 RepID=A0ABX7VVE0_9BACI|nr:YitT family protein [Sediminibacillus dalangtanensis]QTM99560.1 YitT family protein [Sediminibacillus dalangtanensis]
MAHKGAILGLVTLGAIIQGYAMSVFLFPHFIPSGGAGGIAVLFNYWFGLPISVALWIVNFSLLAAAIHWLGNASALGTMYAITVTSLAVQFFDNPLFLHAGNAWLDLLLGSLILGFGIGILLKQGVSNGGMGVIALITAKYRNIPPGKPLLFLNGSVFLLTASIIDWRIVIQAIICQWVSTKMVDLLFTTRFSFLPGLLSTRRKK